MKVNRAELQNALEKVRPGLANREVIEQSTSFAFVGGRVVTYNDEISISHPVTGLDIRGAVKAQELYQFLGKLDKDEIHVKASENEVVIKAGKAKAGLVLQQEVRLPIEEVGEIGDWHDLPDKFTEALRFCVPSCSKNMAQPVLTCVNMRGDGRIESSDGYRVTRYDLPESLPVNTALIPARSVGELVKYDIKQISEGQGWVHFKTGDGTVFSCRVFEDNYPDIENILAFEGTEVGLPTGMAEALKRGQIFAKGEFGMDAMIDVSIGVKKMTVSAQQDYGWFQEDVAVKHDGDPLHFRTNPVFLCEMLEKTNHCVVGQDRIKFKGDEWIHVIALTTED